MKKNNKKLIIKIAFALGALFLVFYSGYGYGAKYGRVKNPPDYIENAVNDSENLDFGLFWQTWNKVRGLYVGRADQKEMLYGAAAGMVASLGDPYTMFLKPQESEDLAADLSGKFEGIGAELTEENGHIIVISPISNSPAERAGIKPKDVILEIDGVSTKDMTIDSAVRKIRGKAGTEVKLKVKHLGQDAFVEFSIKRESISIDSVTFSHEEYNKKKISIIEVSQFGDDTISLARKYIQEAKAKSTQGIIIDLRNNPGGYLDSSIDFSNLFLSKGSVVLKEVDRNGQVTEYKAEDEADMAEIPLVILVNGGSASAAEIVAGAIKDNGRGLTIGEKTFGKGSVQQIEPLIGGAALKVTIAKWLTPKGNEINQIGLSPDITVQLTDQDKAGGRDPQLEKAISELSSRIK